MSRWVQHISGLGAKWEVSDLLRPLWMRDGIVVSENEWLVLHASSKAPVHLLPKSEYVLCDPPEQWENVTEQCEDRITNYAVGESSVLHEGKRIAVTTFEGGKVYRFAFNPFRIERKVRP